MARDASAFDISTKPKPRGRPVSRSVIRETFSTVPCLENRARTASSVAVKGRFPTYSLVICKVLTREIKKHRQVGPASWFVKVCEGERLAGRGVGYVRRPRQTSRKVTSRPAEYRRSEERRVGKECRSRWSPDH